MPTPAPSFQFSYGSHFISKLVGTPLHFFQLIAHISVFRHFSCGCVCGSCRSRTCAQLLVSLEDSEKEKKQCGYAPWLTELCLNVSPTKVLLLHECPHPNSFVLDGNSYTVESIQDFSRWCFIPVLLITFKEQGILVMFFEENPSFFLNLLNAIHFQAGDSGGIICYQKPIHSSLKLQVLT